MLYKRITTEINEKGEREDFVNIAREDLGPTSTADYQIRYEAITVQDVTLEQLIDAIGNDLESENRFSAMGLPGKIVEHVTAIAGADVAKKVLFRMIDEEGFTLGI